MTTGEFFSPEVLAVIGSVASAIITGVVTFKIAKANSDKDCAISREEFVDSHMRTLIDTYQRELAELRADVSLLVRENQLLRLEVVELTARVTASATETHNNAVGIENNHQQIKNMEDKRNEGQSESNVRS